jgi:hypothetical protein
MTLDPVALHEQAREWGRSLLLRAPWQEATERLSLLLVVPHSEWPMMIGPDRATFWLLIDRGSVASLPESIRTPLLERGTIVEVHDATNSSPAATLVVRTVEGVERSIEGVTRHDMETRWAVIRAEAIADRLKRQETLAAHARLLPPDGLERAIRVLWLDANRAAAALWPLDSAPADAFGAAGEFATALLRLGCLLDEGAYPAVDELRAIGRTTRIGLRIASWLDDLGAGVGGDEAAARRTLHAAPQVLIETRTILAERYRDRDWLRDPTAYEMRARRR